VASERHLRAVRALIELWNSGDRELDALAPYLDPAIELESPFASVAGEPYRGYAGIARWMRDIDEQFAEWSILPDHARQVEGRVIVIGHVTARGRGSEMKLEFPAATVCDFAADDRVARLHIYSDVQAALEAVGLECRPRT
jgi:hypothetical protein